MPRSAAGPLRMAKGVAVVSVASYCLCAGQIHIRRRLRTAVYRAPVVAVAAGGSGSFVSPALAIAEQLTADGTEVVFLGEPDGLEGRWVPQHGFRLLHTSSVTLKRPLKSLDNAFTALVRFPLCLLRAAAALSSAAPDVVVGTGGQVAVPCCVAAVALGIPVLLYEGNAIAGTANHHLSLVARRTLLAFESARETLKCTSRCTVVGPVVRAQAVQQAAGPQPQARRAARSALGVGAKGSKLLLVLSGPQGCGYLNAAMHNALPQLLTIPGLHVLWQTGPRLYTAYAAGYASECPSVRVVPSLQDVGGALAAADLVLSRAGAATVAELHATRTPALLVPSPALSEEQQAANAQVLADTGLALVVAQEHVDEHGVGGQLVQLLGADGRQLAAMRDRHQQAMAAAAAAAADGAVTGPGGAASGGGLGGGAAEAAEAARRVCRAVHEAMGR